MPPAVIGVDNSSEHEVVEDESGKLLERSQQDGELYSKPTVGIIYPPPEVRSIFSFKNISKILFKKNLLNVQ